MQLNKLSLIFVFGLLFNIALSSGFNSYTNVQFNFGSTKYKPNSFLTKKEGNYFEINHYGYYPFNENFMLYYHENLDYSNRNKKGLYLSTDNYPSENVFKLGLRANINNVNINLAGKNKSYFNTYYPSRIPGIRATIRKQYENSFNSKIVFDYSKFKISVTEYFHNLNYRLQDFDIDNIYSDPQKPKSENDLFLIGEISYNWSDFLSSSLVFRTKSDLNQSDRFDTRRIKLKTEIDSLQLLNGKLYWNLLSGRIGSSFLNAFDLKNDLNYEYNITQNNRLLLGVDSWGYWEPENDENFLFRIVENYKFGLKYSFNSKLISYFKSQLAFFRKSSKWNTSWETTYFKDFSKHRFEGIYRYTNYNHSYPIRDRHKFKVYYSYSTKSNFYPYCEVTYSIFDSNPLYSNRFTIKAGLDIF